MGKYKVGKLYRKRIIAGDKSNDPNEIHIDELSSGNEGGGSDSSIEYLDLSGVDYMIGGQMSLKTILGSMGYTIKFVNPNNDELTIMCCGALYSGFSSTALQSLDYRAVEIDFNGLYGGSQSMGLITFRDAFFQFDVPQSELDAIPRITKEEFYNLV